MGGYTRTSPFRCLPNWSFFLELQTLEELFGVLIEQFEGERAFADVELNHVCMRKNSWNDCNSFCYFDTTWHKIPYRQAAWRTNAIGYLNCRSCIAETAQSPADKAPIRRNPKHQCRDGHQSKPEDGCCRLQALTMYDADPTAVCLYPPTSDHAE